MHSPDSLDRHQLVAYACVQFCGVLMQGREGKVVAVYRRKWVIHIERITREKVPS